GGPYNANPYPETAVSATGPGGFSDTNPADFTFSYVGTGTTSYAASSTAPTAVGTYTVTATYEGTGNPNIRGGVSSAVPFTISAAGIVGDVFVLNQKASGALTLSGNAVLNVTGTLQVDSSSATAVQLSGNAVVIAATTQIVGGYQAPSSASFVHTP